MCGIAGFMLADTAHDMNDMAVRMGDMLCHRGPDDGNVWINEEAGIGMAHRRLSIIDLSKSGSQPMIDASKRWVISYNGELYNADVLRRRLSSSGVTFMGHSDTEVALEACSLWGVEEATKNFDGMFAFAIWDQSQRKLYLVRDRMGIKPLYYSIAEQAIIFASELDVIEAVGINKLTIDPLAISIYLRMGYIPAPLSIYKQVRKLDNGCILECGFNDFSNTKKINYWSVKQAALSGLHNRFKGGFEEGVECLEDMLQDSVKRQMVSDVPLGIFLSSGIDSSVVTALAQQVSGARINTFSIGFTEQNYNEAINAKRIANHLGTEHHELYLDSRMITRQLPDIVGIHDEPFADSSQIPTFYLAQLAKSRVSVALSGDGGDELFGGYDHYSQLELMLQHPACQSDFPQLHLGISWIKILYEKICSDLFKIPGTRRTLRSSSLKQITRHLNSRNMLNFYIQSQAGNYFIDICNAIEFIGSKYGDELMYSNFGDSSEVAQYEDMQTWLIDDILAKVDRASMYVSLEVRVPILDHNIIEFSWRLPPEMKCWNGIQKRVLKNVLYRHVPRHLLERPKMGFGAPVLQWLNSELRDWANDLLSSEGLALCQYINPKVYDRHLSRYGKGGKASTLLWRAIVLKAWEEKYLH